MREPVLKAVAMPPRLFWAPMQIGLANMAVHFALMFILLGAIDANPLWMVTCFVITHATLASYGAKEPHLARMCMAWGKSGPTRTHSIYSSRGIKMAP